MLCAQLEQNVATNVLPYFKLETDARRRSFGRTGKMFCRIWLHVAISYGSLMRLD